MKYMLVAIICLYIGYRHGWEEAHKTVAKECKQIGWFYVGNESFKCEKVIK